MWRIFQGNHSIRSVVIDSNLYRFELLYQNNTFRNQVERFLFIIIAIECFYLLLGKILRPLSDLYEKIELTQRDSQFFCNIFTSEIQSVRNVPHRLPRLY